MRTPRWYPTVVQFPDGRLVAMGGQVKKGLMANVTELYDPATNRWVELPGLSQSKPLGVYPQALLAPNGQEARPQARIRPVWCGLVGSRRGLTLRNRARMPCRHHS